MYPDMFAVKTVSHILQTHLNYVYQFYLKYYGGCYLQYLVCSVGTKEQYSTKKLFSLFELIASICFSGFSSTASEAWSWTLTAVARDAGPGRNRSNTSMLRPSNQSCSP